MLQGNERMIKRLYYFLGNGTCCFCKYKNNYDFILEKQNNFLG